MIVYVPHSADGEIGEVFSHPARALAEAQRLATELVASTGAPDDGDGLAGLSIEFRADEDWGACCADCYRAVGDVHTCPRRRGDGVLPHEGVVRPAQELTRSAR